MGIASRLVVAAALCVLGISSSALAARPERCPGGRFTVAPPALLTGGDVTPGGTLTILTSGDAVQVALGTACRAEEQVAAALTRKRRGTQLSVTWSACTGARGRVRLRGLIASDGCAAFSGTLRGRGLRLRLDATRAAVVCGDGLVDPGEACDPTTATPSCGAGQGCVRGSDRCGCLPLCGGTGPSEDALDAAIAAALAAHPDALATADGFDAFRGDVQAALGCALNPGSLQPTVPDPLPAPGGFNSATQYCGPADSTADWRLGLVAPDACLNLACYKHDRCTTAGGADCDGALLRACGSCTGSGAGTLFSWLTPDSFVLCSALQSLVGGGTTSTTTTSIPTATVPGATSTSSTQTTVPGATSSTTGTTATSSSTAVAPTSTSTTSTTSTTASAQGKDLIPENIVLEPSEVTAGGTILVTWDVTNHGTVAVSENFCDKIYLSSNAVLDAGDAFLVAQCHFGVYDPGEADTRSLDVTIPADMPTGPAFLLIETDVQATVSEGNEGNNVAAAGFSVIVASQPRDAGGGSSDAPERPRAGHAPTPRL